MSAPRDRQGAWRAERRRAARRHHPDLGGDAREYVQAMATIDARYGLRADPGRRPPHAWTTTRAGPLTAARRAVRRAARRARRATRTIQAHLPRAIPGARRYTTL